MPDPVINSLKGALPCGRNPNTPKCALALKSRCTCSIAKSTARRKGLLSSSPFFILERTQRHSRGRLLRVLTMMPATNTARHRRPAIDCSDRTFPTLVVPTGDASGRRLFWLKIRPLERTKENKMKKTCLTLASAALGALALSTLAAPFAYVPNEESGTISVIDTSTDQVVKEIKAGDKPRGLAVSRDGKKLYVSDQPHNSLVVIDLEKLERVDSIFLGESPEGVGISPDGKWIVAAVEGSNSIAFINTQTSRKEFLVKVRGENPEHAVFSPDGKWVFSSAEEAHQIDVIDVAQRKQGNQIEVG